MPKIRPPDSTIRIRFRTSATSTFYCPHSLTVRSIAASNFFKHLIVTTISLYTYDIDDHFTVRRINFLTEGDEKLVIELEEPYTSLVRRASAWSCCSCMRRPRLHSFSVMIFDFCECETKTADGQRMRTVECGGCRRSKSDADSRIRRSYFWHELSSIAD